jgi:hypothetical protein
MSPRKIILSVFMGLALISFGAGIYVDTNFSQHSPKQPRPDEGKVYQHVANKTTVYLTKWQWIVSYIPVYGFILSFGALAYFGVRWKLIKLASRQPKPQLPKAEKKKTDDTNTSHISGT